MKVLIIGPLPNPINGCSLANEVLMANLKKNGVACNAINTSTASVSSHQGKQFSFRKAIGFVSTYFELYKIFFSQIVYLTPGQTFFGILKYAPFILLCIISGKPYVIHIHGNYLGREYAKLQGIKASIFRFLLSKASAGIVLSASLKNNFARLLPDDKVFVVENFVEDKIIQQFDVCRKKNDIIRVVFLSNLMKEKGIIDVLDAMILLKKDGVDFKAKIAGIIEHSVNDIILDKLKDLDGIVEYVGIVKGEAKLNILTEANVFILPTYYEMEGQPISILEAMGTGNIIISTPHAGIPDIMTLENGYFVEPQNPNNIASILKEISTNVRAALQQYASSNAAYIKNNFTENKFQQKICNVLLSTLKK